MSSFTLADAVVSVKEEGTDKTVGAIQSKVGGLSGGMGKMGLGIGSALAVGIGGAIAAANIGGFIMDGIRGAGELEQSVGAIDAVFKGSASEMHEWSSGAADAVGLTKNEFNELGSLIGSQLKNGGTAMEDLAPKANKLIGLGADLSSMYGGTTKQAVEALSSALKGERDPIEAYGVSLNQSKIDAEAAALGYKKVGGALSDEANQAATLSLIMKQTSDAHGNFAKESDTLAGKQQRLSAMWSDGKTAIMSAFLPALTTLTGWMLGKLPGALAFLTMTGQKVVDFFSYVSGYISGQGSSADIGWLEGPAERVAIVAIWLQNAGGTIRDTISYIAGYVSGEGANVDIGWLEGPAETIAHSIIGIKAAFANGDLGASLGTMLTAARPAGPVLVAVAEGLAGMSDVIADLVTATLPVLPPLISAATGAMTLLTSNSTVLKSVIVGIVAAYATYRGAMIASNAVMAINNTLTGLKNAKAAVSAAWAAANATAVAGHTAMVATNTGVTVTNVAAQNAGIITQARAGAAFLAAKVALVAGTVATGAATAAQWLFNVALNANPIGLVVLAITALVGGLIWFFTQTELGKSLWSGFVGFITDSLGVLKGWWDTIWAAISLTVTTVFGAVVDWITNTWNNLVLGFQIIGDAWSTWWTNLWNGIVSFVTGVFTAYITWLTDTWNGAVSLFQGIGDAWASWWSGLWNGAVSFVTGLFNGYISWLVGAWNGVVGTFRGIGEAFAGWWSGLWNRFGQVIGIAVGVTRQAVDNVIGVFRNIQGTVTGLLSGAGSWLVNAGRSIIDGLVNGIKGAIGKVRDILGSVTNLIPDWKGPAERDAILLRPAGGLIMGGLVDGIEDGKKPLRRSLSGITAGIPSMAPVAPLAPVTQITPRGGDTYNMTVTIDASSLSEVNDVVELFDKIKRAARAGKAA